MRILFLNQYYLPDVAVTGQFLADVQRECRHRVLRHVCGQGTWASSP